MLRPSLPTVYAQEMQDERLHRHQSTQHTHQQKKHINASQP